MSLKWASLHATVIVARQLSMEVLILMVIFGSITSMVLGWRYMKHRERIAELEVRKVEALAQQSPKMLPEDRRKLANELLEAYEEAGQNLSSDL